MIVNEFQFNIIKVILMVLTFAFIAFAAHASEPILDIEPCYVCTNCQTNEYGEYQIELNRYITSNNTPPVWLSCADIPAINPGDNGMISAAILNPDLTDFFSVSSAELEIADLGASAEYKRYTIEDVNHDGATDIVFYFLTQDLVSETSGKPEMELSSCLTADIINTDRSISLYYVCDMMLLSND